MSSAVVYGEPDRSAAAEKNAALIHARIEQLVLSLRPTSVLEIGSGRGRLGARLAARGIRYTGVEPTASEVEAARQTHPGLDVVHASCYDVPEMVGKFDVVVSNDVIEHLYDPRALARVSRKHLINGGRIVCGTPDYGDYWRNLLIAVGNKWDAHHTALWDGGHIKFFSRATLGKIWAEEGFTDFKWGHLNYKLAPFMSWYLHCTARLP
jgi:2-polyprenyl-3-methyl-5-hydroxy-6-metoxy-1,4-benzoquinol methylase